MSEERHELESAAQRVIAEEESLLERVRGALRQAGETAGRQ